MARIRANLNSFSTGFVSKKVRGNVDFEGYNNGLEECVNFSIQHTGGIFKRGGTEFVAYTRHSNKAELIPFYFGTESYMCEFGDLSEPQENNNHYIRFYTKLGLQKEIFHNFFSLEDLSFGSTFQQGANLTIVMLTKIVNITSDDANGFVIEEVFFTYPPLSKTNYDHDKSVKISEIPGQENRYKIESKTSEFYESDATEVIAVSGKIAENASVMSFRIMDFIDRKTIEVQWEDGLNYIKKPPIENGSEFVQWSVSQFTEDRVKADQISKLGVAMYEGRLFLSANNMIWGSSLARGDPLDFLQEPSDDGGVSFSIAETKSDDVVWLSGKSKLFIATHGGLFMSGAATTNDSSVTPSNFRVRLFEKLGVSSLPPISANNAIFFVDIMNRNVHEIVLSAETGAYQANDLSLIGEDLTHSGIIAHAWQQNPIKTYWCAVNDGYLSSLTYLKNNGIMAWSKHIISGKNAKVETISTLTTKSSDNIWMIVKRQATKDSGEQEIVRSIEYMHPIYDPLAQEEFKQFFVDSGKIKEIKHTILNITNGYNYYLSLDKDIRIKKDSFEEKIMFASLDNKINFHTTQGEKQPNPFFSFSGYGSCNMFGKPLIARNFYKEGDKFEFDVFECYDYKRDNQFNLVVPYRNQAITHGKINIDEYKNNFDFLDPKPNNVGIFVKVADIRKIDTSAQTKIFCDTTNIQSDDTVLLRGTGYVVNTDENGRLEYEFINQNKYNVVKDNTEYFFIQKHRENRYISSEGNYTPEFHGEVFKLVKTIPFSAISDALKFGEDAVFEVKNELNTPENGYIDVYVNKVSGMDDVNNKKYRVKKAGTQIIKITLRSLIIQNHRMKTVYMFL